MCMACPRSRRRAFGIPLRFDSGGGALDTQTSRCSSLRSRQERFTELREEAIRTIASISYMETCRSKLYQTCDVGFGLECHQGCGRGVVRGPLVRRRGRLAADEHRCQQRQEAQRADLGAGTFAKSHNLLHWRPELNRDWDMPGTRRPGGMGGFAPVCLANRPPPRRSTPRPSVT